VRAALIASALLLAALSACRKSEAFVDEERRFESLETGIGFSLQAAPKEIQKLIVNFFAPDCPPCEKEVPALKKFYQKYRQNPTVGFFAVGSSLKAVEQNPKPGKDPPLTRETIRSELLAFDKKFAPAYPQYLAEGADLKAWRVTGFPETFIFIRYQGGWQFKKKIISEISFELLEGELNGSDG
jgi:thiol-disulfide isomerase/thioredoxin